LTLGIVVGLAAEARIACRLGGWVQAGGGTPDGARRAAEVLIGRGATALLSFGLAGGLDPALRPGAIVVPAGVLTVAPYQCDPGLLDRLGGQTAQTVFAAHTIIATRQEKHRLHTETGAAAVDLESGAVAEAAARHGLRFAVLRAICDPAERDLPAFAAAALDAEGRIGILRVLRTLLRDPRQIAGAIALAGDAARARRALIARIDSIGTLS
jgi:adenosylhomocysteine nucleosidase